MMIDNITSPSVYPRPVVSETQTDLNQIFRGLKRRPRPEFVDPSTQASSIERYRKNLRINNDHLKDVQNALQVFHELHSQGQSAFQVVAQLQQAVSELLKPELSPDKHQELIKRIQELQKILQNQALPQESSLAPLLAKYDPEQGVSNMPATIGGIPVHPERFDLTLPVDVSVEPAHMQNAQQQLTQFGDRLNGFLAYVEALQNRMQSKLKMLDRKAPTEFQRLETIDEAKKLLAKTSQQIVNQPQVALNSQANLSAANTSELLSAA